MADTTALVNKERAHLRVLQRRLAWLHEGPRDEPDGGFESIGCFAGEANALAWVLSLVESAQVSDTAAAINRIEHRLRTLESRLGRIEHEWKEADEE